ncbi:MAG: ATP-binding protein [Anaerolineales bacterium]|nr:ATP-binding protein [Anaerolineales bacterium]
MTLLRLWAVSEPNLFQVMPIRTFPGRYASLAEISEFVANSAQEAGLDKKGVYAVKLAVDEACTNIIEHGYGGEGDGKIECSCDIGGDALTIRLRDWGKTFDPCCVPEPDFDVPLEELQARGAGLYFMYELMDTVKFSFHPKKGNLLVMVKKV